MGVSSSRTTYLMNDEGDTRIIHEFKTTERFDLLKLAMAAEVYGDRAVPYSADFIQLCARTTSQGDFNIGCPAHIPHGTGDAAVVVKLLPGGAADTPGLSLPPHQGSFLHKDDVIDETKAPTITRTNEATSKVFPIVMLGQAGVGKTSLIHRFSKQVYSKTHIPTLNMDVENVTLNIADVVVKVRITDTAGGTRFSPLADATIPTSRGAIIMFDVCCRSSYKAALKLIRNVKRHHSALLEQGLVLLVAAKIDKEEQRIVTQGEASEAADKRGVYYYETSAREGLGIHPPFHFMATKLLKLYPACLGHTRMGSPAAAKSKPYPASFGHRPGSPAAATSKDGWCTIL